MSDVHNLPGEGQALLAEARAATSGRASLSIVHADQQRAVLMGLAAGHGLSEHDAPPAATLQVVTGRIRLYVAGEDGQEWLLQDGDIVPIPQARHGVDALSDSVVLLTVSL